MSTAPSGSLPALEYIKAHLSWGRPGAKTGVYAKQHSVSLPRAASQPPLPSSFYPGNCCRVPTVRRWRVLYCTGYWGNATLLLNLDTGAALLLGWGWIWGAEQHGELHYFFFLDLNDQPIVQRRYLCMMCPWNVCCVSLCMMCGVTA